MKKNLRVPPSKSMSPLSESSSHQRGSRKQDAYHKAEGASQGGNFRQETGERFVSHMGWSILMHRIFIAFLGKGEAWAEEPFSACRLPVRRACEMVQVSQKSIYEGAAEATTRLTREPIELWSRDRKNYEGYSIG
jgi:hypothetical protein